MPPINQDQISFHDSTIVSLTHVGTTVRLTLEYVFVGDDQKTAEISIEGVSAILRNEKPKPNCEWKWITQRS